MTNCNLSLLENFTAAAYQRIGADDSFDRLRRNEPDPH